jgi:hypothetical protein
VVLERDREALAAADALEWAARHAEVERQAEAARRERKKRRAEAEVEQRSQVRAPAGSLQRRVAARLPLQVPLCLAKESRR